MAIVLREVALTSVMDDMCVDAVVEGIDGLAKVAIGDFAGASASIVKSVLKGLKCLKVYKEKRFLANLKYFRRIR